MAPTEEHQAAYPAHTMNASNKDDATVDVAADKEQLAAEDAQLDSGGINAADEVKGLKLALIILGLCFSNILTGLVCLLQDRSGGCPYELTCCCGRTSH